MKAILFFIFLCSSCAFADETNCFKRGEIDSLVTGFFSSSDNFGYVKKMATEKLKDKLPYYEENNQINNIMKHATQIIFNRGYPGDYESSKQFIDNYPNINNFPNNGCVWKVTFLTPEKIRKMCDDDGAAGYFFGFIKINGEIKFSSILGMEILRPDGSFVCKGFDRYMKE
ncbi:TPA: hypothetical protein RY409_001180 [Escherichia albertii]|uniref:hypothetical protein n=2 Tax=Escherichia albertii TaxID=208962 RepID=UPI000722A806|nr:hypothetical protein [Escherichia albertii]EFO1261847.1 hypothetical protein [Escherichia albertii]EJZ9663879.1 hypothetical protein [Escherichia albertii]EKB4282698.1 hypothetical protein [Escherichia albertii]MCQ8915368.1 hypothetical protein [Escherichia albertii]MCQ8925996.1 hypothetical protein [Escherichia albertii]